MLRQKKWLVLCLILLIGLIPTRISWAGEIPTIRIRAVADVKDAEIYLKDIVEFTEKPETLIYGKVYLGIAPLPGSSRRLTKGQIEVRLRQAGFDPRQLNIIGATEVRVTRVVPDSGDVSNKVEKVAAIIGDNDLNTYQVVVPIRNIARHELIDQGDLALEKREGRTTPSNLASIEDLVGKRATRQLIAGNPLTLSAGEVPPVIDRLDQVTIIAQIGQIQVTALGQARQSGIKGDIIPVENLNSKRIVYGKIINSESVIVEIGGLK